MPGGSPPDWITFCPHCSRWVAAAKDWSREHRWRSSRHGAVEFRPGKPTPICTMSRVELSPEQVFRNEERKTLRQLNRER